jgi:hypothetical protein
MAINVKETIACVLAIEGEREGCRGKCGGNSMFRHSVNTKRSKIYSSFLKNILRMLVS